MTRPNNRTITFDDGLPCIISSWPKTENGYGRKWGRRHHRYVWLKHYGPDSLLSHEVIMHMCDNPGCIRLTHLTLGDPKRNIHDSQEKGRRPTSTKPRGPKVPKQTVLGYLL